MRSAPISTAALLAFFVLAAPAMAFDVQNGGGQAGGTANLAPEASSVPGVSLDQDLRAQLGIADDRADGGEPSPGCSSASPAAAPAPKNQTTMGYDESPWVAPRAAPGAN